MIGNSVGRKEDLPLLTGSAKFLDDLILPGMLHLGVVRSPHAHARILGIATSGATALPQVVGIFGAKDLPELDRPIPPYKAKRKFRAFDQYVLARSIVRYVGEPVAAVVAEDLHALPAALDAVMVDYDAQPAVGSTDAAIQAGAPLVHAHWPDNVAFVARTAIGDVDAAMRGADVLIEERFRHPRVAPMPIETRGAIAYTDDAGALIVVSTSQHPYHLREAIAHVLGLAEESIRVISPTVGGSFGAKGQVYAEEILAAALALKLQRPVKWVETRNEHFIATSHDREQVHEIRAGFTRDGRIVAIDDRFWADFGAYPVQDDGVSINTVNHLCGPYQVAHYRSECVNVVTHKMFSAAYRAAGRPEAAFVMDRVLDIAARRLRMDPAEIRRRNLVPHAEMPFRPGLLYKDSVPVSFDPADFPGAFDRLLELFGYAEARALQQQRAGGTCRIGVGLSCYVQGTGMGPFEGANVRVDRTGKVTVHLGISSQGQSHQTTLAQVCAQSLGVSFDDVAVVIGDTQALPYGFGAYGSRVAANAGPAVARAARVVRAKALKVAASMLEAAEEDLRITAGRVHIIGVPARGVPLAEVARLAVTSKQLMPDPGLNACAYFNPENVTWAFGAQAAAV